MIILPSAKGFPLKPTAVFDPYFQYVRVLLHFDGANGSNTFLDSGRHYYRLTANDNAQMSTSQKKFGNTSAYFDGVNDYITIPSFNQEINYSTRELTIEFWMYPASNNSTQRVCLASLVGCSVDMILNSVGPGSIQIFQVANSGPNYPGIYVTIAPSGTIPLNAWSHVAICLITPYLYHPPVAYVYINGSLVGSDNLGNGVPQSNGPTYIGGYSDSFFNGYIDDFRFTESIARYKSNFVIPTSAFPENKNGTDKYYNNTQLLLSMNNSSFTDSSLSPSTITANGAVSISTDQYKFGGSSAFFAGGYLSIPDNSKFNLWGDFTIEGWIRPSAWATASSRSYFPIIDSNRIANDCNNYYAMNWRVYYSPYDGNKFVFMYQDASENNYFIYSNATTINFNTWYHFAVERSNGVITFYLNGIAIGSTSNSFAFNQNTGLWIGRMATQLTFCQTTNWYSSGYIDSIRITDLARYRSNFTPSTSEFPSSFS
jgi:hypothetical protein